MTQHEDDTTIEGVMETLIEMASTTWVTACRIFGQTLFCEIQIL